MSPAAPPSVVHLRLSRAQSVDPDAVCALFAVEVADWLGTPVGGGDLPAGVRRYAIDLSLPLRERTPQMVLRKAAYVDIGEVRLFAGGCEVDISWRSATLAPLFPVFVGHLTITASDLRLEGYYAPPGGELGVVLDRALLGVAARGTARWFLERVGEGLVALTGAPRVGAAAGPFGAT